MACPASGHALQHATSTRPHARTMQMPAPAAPGSVSRYLRCVNMTMSQPNPVPSMTFLPVRRSMRAVGAAPRRVHIPSTADMHLSHAPSAPPPPPLPPPSSFSCRKKWTTNQGPAVRRRRRRSSTVTRPGTAHRQVPASWLSQATRHAPGHAPLPPRSPPATPTCLRRLGPQGGGLAAAVARAIGYQLPNPMGLASTGTPGRHVAAEDSDTLVKLG